MIFKILHLIYSRDLFWPKETKTYKYDMVNGMLPKTVEVFTGCKVGDVIEMMGKEWRIEDVIF